MDLVREYGMLEVGLADDEDFLKVMETLTRIGVSYGDNTLCQSCHILHKQGKYYIAHFKELFKLDGKPSNFTDDDRYRRNTIAKLLQDWGLVSILTPTPADEVVPVSKLKIIPYAKKQEWELVTKYNIGKKK